MQSAAPASIQNPKSKTSPLTQPSPRGGEWVQNPASSRDAALAKLVDSYLARLQAGEAIDAEVFAAEHPEHAERLARLLPALELMDDLRRSSASAGSGLSLTPVLMGTPGVTPGLLGDFQIVREVGRGGMGVVYEARQISLNRRVALKVLPLAAAMDARQLQRFHLEAQAAACLHHTNIVPIHAVGCERGVHYYAMQFIDCQTLAAIIGELRVFEGLDEAAETQTKESKSTLASRLAGGELAPAEAKPESAVEPPPAPFPHLAKGGEGGWGHIAPTRPGFHPTNMFGAGLPSPLGERMATGQVRGRSPPPKPPTVGLPARASRSHHRHPPQSQRARSPPLAAAPSFARLPAWASRPPKRSSTPTVSGWSTATSSRPICLLISLAHSGSPTSAWPGSETTRA